MIVPPIASRAFVGRHIELQALRELRKELALGHGSVALVAGEAGIGKTRLLGEFCAHVKGGGRAPHIVHGECLEHAPRPLGPFRSVVTALARGAPWLAREAPAVVLQALRQMALQADGTAVVADAPSLSKADLFDALVTFFELVARKRSTIVVLEDLHWADPATLELLRHLAPRIAGTRIMLVASFRDDEAVEHSPLGEALTRLRRESTVHLIALEPLGRDELRELFRSALEGRGTLRAEALRDVERLCEGNPFFAEELLKSALEREGPKSALPVSIRATILERLVNLNDGERHVLQHAAVLGYRFDPQTLALILERDIAAIMPALQRARDQNLIVEEPKDRIRFRFRHALTRQTLYEGLLALAARPLHERIARTLEALPGASEHLDELAYHWYEARDGAKALAYGERAGDAALGVNAFSEAATYFARALEFPSSDAHRASLLSKLGMAYANQSFTARALNAFVESTAIRVRLGEYEPAAQTIGFAASQVNNSGDSAGSDALIDDFLRDHGAHLSRSSRDGLRTAQAISAANASHAARARALLALVEAPEELDAYGRMRYWLASATVNTLVEAETARERDIATIVADVPTGSVLYDVLILKQVGMLSIFAGRPLQAERFLVRALDLSEQGFIGLHADANALRSANHFLAGRLGEARTALLAALAHAHHFGTRYHISLFGPFLALALGDEMLAARCIDIDYVESEAAGASVIASSAIVPLAAGRTNEARAILERAVDRLEVTFLTMFLMPLAARYVDERRLQKLLRLTDTGDPERRVLAASGAHVRAIVAEREGRIGDARALALDAARRYDEIGWPLLRAQSLEIAGEADAANAIYRRCGSVADLRRLELRRDPGPLAAPLPSGVLSKREREVAVLVARGLTNRAVAQVLAVGEKTIEKHVSSIYQKLGFSTRARLAAYVAAPAAGNGHAPPDAEAAS